MKKKLPFRVRPVTLKNIFLLTLGPVLFISLLGLVFSKIFVEEIPMGILDMDNSSISRNVVKQFEETSKFKVVYRAQTDEELNEAIKTKKVSVGLIIPHNFAKDANAIKAPKTLLLIDETNIVIGNNALSYGSEILNTINAGIQLNVLEANNMVPYAAQKSIGALSFTERILYDPQLSYMRYLLYAMIGAVVQQVYIGALAPVLIEEKLSMVKMKLRSKEGVRKLLKISLKILVFATMAAVGATGSLYAAGKYFYLPLKGSLIDYFILLTVFLLDLTAISFVFAFVFDAMDQCVRFSMFLSVPTFLTAGYVWPEYMMPAGFFSVVKKIWPLVYFINPLKTINLKGVDFAVIAPYVQGGIYYALFWLPVGVGLYLFKIFGFKVVQRKLMKPKENVSD
ncbi:ABC transporter permease [Clostridium sp. A1-XYC3]|uniref:ABC transporter permease n=1 Tax=Clostridium tanneri TaxID=3037988 RepID=A0ABU4JVP5_9CLOT|nr:ABC transporter permease [Clostridium sp. A1-XYC3]MDW8802203.1 ABC transporter permease [Clostridium sp. A1-XYC3]